MTKKKNLSVHCVGHRNLIPNRDRSRGWCILPSKRIVIRSYFPILVYGALEVHAECEDQSRRKRPNKLERRPTLKLCGSILSPADFRFLNDRAKAFSTAAKHRMVRCLRGAMRDQPILMGLIDRARRIEAGSIVTHGKRLWRLRNETQGHLPL